MADRSSFENYLHSLSSDGLQDVIASLEAYEDEFTPAHVVPGTVVLENLAPDLPARSKGMFELDARAVVGRVVYRLLRAAGDHDAVTVAAQEILPDLTSLSASST